MLKFIPMFHSWKAAPGMTFVICACARTHEQLLVIVTGNGNILPVSADLPMPDIRMYVPCKWQALPTVIRARVRQQFHDHLVAVHGAEIVANPAWNEDSPV